MGWGTVSISHDPQPQPQPTRQKQQGASVRAYAPRSWGLQDTYDSKGSSMLSRQEGVPSRFFPNDRGLSCCVCGGGADFGGPGPRV